VSVYVPAGVPLTGGGGGGVLPPPPPQPVASAMAANRTTEGIRYASFLARIRATLIAAQDCFIFSLPLPSAIDKSIASRVIPETTSRFTGFCGVAEGPGRAALRAVVVTPILMVAGPLESSVNGGGPLQVACFGAPVQVMVTFNDPVAPAAIPSCRL
jgi:hypothetical protein